MVLLVKESTQTKHPSRKLPLVAELGFEDSSPFGLQGLERDTLTVLKPDSIKQLAASLALSYSSQELTDSQVAETFLAKNPQWSDVRGITGTQHFLTITCQLIRQEGATTNRSHRP